MRRILKHIPRGAAFDKASCVHDANAVRDKADHWQIVADKQIRQTKLTLQVHEDIENLRLYRDIKR